jgi:hypothetical protein
MLLSGDRAFIGHDPQLQPDPFFMIKVCIGVSDL